MSIFKVCIVSAALSLSLASVGARVAAADPPSVVVEAPFFYPRAEFRYDDDGYYRTRDGHFYHYDRDRDGWHWGRTHREGMRYEDRHHHGRR
jgi:hypothetical protein